MDRLSPGTITLILTALFALADPLRAEDWPQWRGPRLDGTSTEKKLPLRWSATENIAWKTTIPGIGHSSPIVVGDSIFATSCILETQERIVICLSRETGQELWKRVVFTSPFEPKHQLNSYASSTPASDGERVYVNFLRLRAREKADLYPIHPREKSRVPSGLVAEMVLSCYSMTGSLIWQKAVGQFYSVHGFCSPPVLYRDLVILNGDQDAEGYLVAIDKSSGDEKWRADRAHRTRSYCAPLILKVAGKMQMILTGSEMVTSYDPQTGRLLWQVDGPTEQFVASPVFGDGLVFLTAGFPTYHNMAIRPDGTGNVTSSHVVWHEKETSPRKAAYVPSPMAYRNLFYVISDQGYLNCLEAKTGRRLWMERLGEHHSASPVLADDHIYLTDDEGTTHVVKAGPVFEEISRNPLGARSSASPAISHGQIFLRTSGHLWCVGRAN